MNPFKRFMEWLRRPTPVEAHGSSWQCGMQCITCEWITEGVAGRPCSDLCGDCGTFTKIAPIVFRRIWVSGCWDQVGTQIQGGRTHWYQVRRNIEITNKAEFEGVAND